MALLWSKEGEGVRYEVRSAGRTRRLYTDGVFHSQFHPDFPVTGTVWDLLMLPAFFHGPESIRRVLVLGVGGGTVVRQLLHFVGPAEIVGVELSAVHLRVARRFFGLDRRGVTLIQGDARQWVRDYRGPPFDLIIEDLFGGEAGEPVRAMRASGRWLAQLTRRLSCDGTLVMNFVSGEELGRSGYFTNQRVRGRFGAAFRLHGPVQENVVAAFLRRSSDSRRLRARLRRHSQLGPALTAGRLSYRIRPL